MSLTIEVIRGLGDKPSPTDLSCNYFTSEEIFSQVGRVEIDKATEGLKIVTMTLPGIRQHIRRGLIIRIQDGGREYRGKVQSTLYSVGRDDDGKPFATCSMTIRMMEVL